MKVLTLWYEFGDTMCPICRIEDGTLVGVGQRELRDEVRDVPNRHIGQSVCQFLLVPFPKMFEKAW